MSTGLKANSDGLTGELQVNGSTVLSAVAAGISIPGTLTVTGNATSSGYFYGIGSVVQVVTGTTTTATTTTSSSYADTTLTASITPKFSTSKVLVLIMQQTYFTRAADNAQVGYIQAQRNGTDIGTLKQLGTYAQGVASVASFSSVPLIILDSPASASALTYKTQAAVSPTISGSQLTTQPSGQLSTIVLMEIGA